MTNIDRIQASGTSAGLAELEDDAGSKIVGEEITIALGLWTVSVIPLAIVFFLVAG